MDSNSQPMSEQDIMDALSDLQSKNVWVRRNRIEILRERKITDDRVVEALKIIVSQDADESISAVAEKALRSFGIIPPVALPETVTDFASFTRRYKQQIQGFVGWFIIATLISPWSFGLITTPGTIIALIAFGASKKQKGVAGGMLVAVALNFAISLIRGLELNYTCFIPFVFDQT